MEQIRFEEMGQLASGPKESEDALMEEARKLAQEHKQISSSFLQRRLRIGYPRAARIFDKLEEEGYTKKSDTQPPHDDSGRNPEYPDRKVGYQ